MARKFIVLRPNYTPRTCLFYKPYKCSLCDLILADKCYTKTHILSFHEGNSPVCDKCSKKFSCKANLARHVFTMHSERATLRVVLIHLRRLTPKVSTCSYDRFLCQ